MKERKDTNESYLQMVEKCKKVFIQKARDYGTSWRIMRLSSITDQIYIKAERIRNIEETKINLVGDSIEGEYIGIVNYSIMALIIYSWKGREMLDPKVILQSLDSMYDEQAQLALETMKKKNHDYGEAWRRIRISSITDLILMKLLRLKQIEDNDGKTNVSEGVDANYVDIINYAIFVLIRMNEEA